MGEGGLPAPVSLTGVNNDLMFLVYIRTKPV